KLLVRAESKRVPAHATDLGDGGFAIRLAARDGYVDGCVRRRVAHDTDDILQHAASPPVRDVEDLLVRIRVVRRGGDEYEVCAEIVRRDLHDSSVSSEDGV